VDARRSGADDAPIVLGLTYHLLLATRGERDGAAATAARLLRGAGAAPEPRREPPGTVPAAVPAAAPLRAAHERSRGDGTHPSGHRWWSP
jgi:hypothetical protein